MVSTSCHHLHDNKTDRHSAKSFQYFSEMIFSIVKRLGSLIKGSLYTARDPRPLRPHAILEFTYKALHKC